VPVELSRKSASEKFILKWTEDDIEENLSLGNKLKQDFDIELPLFPNEENFDLTEYFEGVEAVISSAKGWEVLPNEITLGFFSFAKFLMFRDLDKENWPNPSHLLDQPFISGLLQDGFPQSDSLFSDDSYLDDLIPVSRLDHVVDADSTQTQAIESVRQGHSLVIQGPPGTGKSQSITNIISTAVLDGKRVLFVAEKLAALEVVKRRLEKEGLGPICLELHSNKSKKRTVIEEIGKTWQLRRPKATDLEELIPKLEQKRAVLNKHVNSLHEKHNPSGLTPFSVIGHLSALGDRGRRAGEYTFAKAENWTRDQRHDNRGVIEELAQCIQQIGLPAKHPWRGVCLEAILQIDLDPLSKRIRQAAITLANLQETSLALASNLSQPVPKSLAETEKQLIIARFVAQAPRLDKEALCDSVWDFELDALRDLIFTLFQFAKCQKQTDRKVVEAAWGKEFSEARSRIAAHGQSFFRFFNAKYRAAIAEIRSEMSAEMPKLHSERLAFIDTLISGQQSLRKIHQYEMIGHAAFGSLWRREKSDSNQCGIILEWVVRQNEAGLSSSFRKMFAGISDPSVIVKLVEQLGECLATARETIQKLFTGLSIDCCAAFTEQGLLSNEERAWKLTPLGKTAANVAPSARMKMDQFAKRHAGLRGDALVAETYRRFPYHAIRSEMAARVLAGDEVALQAIEEARPSASFPGLCTIGYEGRSLERYLNLLLMNGVTVLCDVRRNPLSRKYGFSKGTLSKSCEGVGIRYEHLPELGIATEQRQGLDTQADYDVLFAIYERDTLPKQNKALIKIRQWIEIGERVALTCYESSPEQCHRHCVAEALEAEVGSRCAAQHL